MEGGIVVDVVYRKTPTQLVKNARKMGLRVIDGFEILRTQVQHQFIGMTGLEMQETLASHLAQPKNNFAS